MPVFAKETTRILYIHAPKTGGTFVESCFKRSGFSISLLQRPDDPLIGLRKCSPQHYHANILNSIFRMDHFDLIFITVRHPVLRCLSEYRMRQPDVESRSAQDFHNFLEKCFDTFSTNPFCYDNHVRPQADFFLEGALVTKQEHSFRDEWAKKLAKASKTSFSLRVKTSDLANATSRADNIVPYAKTISMIGSFYARDFQNFNYDLED